MTIAMNIIKFIIQQPVSIFFGWLTNLLIEKGFGQILKKSEKKRISDADEDLKQKRILSLSHLKPKFNSLDKTDIFFIPFPDEYKDIVEEHNPMFLQNAITDWKVFKTTKNQGASDLAKLLFDCVESGKDLYLDDSDLRDITIDEINKIIIESRNAVAKDFSDQLKKGFIRFNGIMFGVKQIIESDKNAEIDLFKTDYFTNRVMNEVYERLVKENAIKDFTSPKLVNNFYPLLTALGVDTIIQLHNRTTMLVKRSELLPNMDKKTPLWHVSMNEAISRTDYKDDTNNTVIDEVRCVKRGLLEELHIPDTAIDEKSVEFKDVYFLMSKCEIGIASTVKLKKNITEKQIRFAHYGAKDSMLESKEYMKTIILTKYWIERFIEEEDSKEDEGITESCRYVLTMMKCRMH